LSPQALPEQAGVQFARTKVATTVRSEVIVSMQVAPDVESHPDHPEKLEPLADAALSVTAAPEGADSLQVVPQLMPPPEMVPEPLPLF
jgi:hypothetical protein